MAGEQVKQRVLCCNCTHALMGASGVFCPIVNELMWDETVAEECSEYLSDRNETEKDNAGDL